jgi:probable rRNA maturation factor
MNDDTRYDLNLLVQTESSDLPEKRIADAVTWLLKMHHTAPGTGISVVITNDEEVRRLNQQFRGVNAPTDVLSFPADPVPEGEEPYLGDLILALPHIRRQAESEQHSVADELVLAVIHGTLHLLGYDHDTLEHQSAMWEIQAKALRVVGVKIIVPLFEFPGDTPSA